MAKVTTSSSTIWRTVVFAGAMLGTPTLVAAEQAAVPPAKAPGAPAPKGGAGAPATPAAAAKPIPMPDPASQKQGQIKALDTERTALLAKIVETDPKELDALKKQIVAKDTQIKKLVDELVTLRKPRPRTPLVQKPVGRGFVLA